MTGADKKSGKIPLLTGNSLEDVFAFLVATVEYQKKKGIFPRPIYTPFIELETQQAVIGQFETRDLICNVYLHDSGLDWHLSQRVADEKGTDSSFPKEKPADAMPLTLFAPFVRIWEKIFKNT
ncbi:MAG: hypothetical protein C0469_09140 [Cyanobacteria bacterium DS2.3.42]|nr:hypothetical protein [Cyanobacteria bacterium DS2.3.42]